MKSALWTIVVAVVMVVVGSHTYDRTAVAAQTRGSTARDVPTFRVDPAWPKIPNGWQFGQVSSVAVDAQDHVWILQRPATIAPEERSKAAPPVLEFTNDGRFVRAWGGPGKGYEWPSSEHGIHVDP